MIPMNILVVMTALRYTQNVQFRKETILAMQQLVEDCIHQILEIALMIRMASKLTHASNKGVQIMGRDIETAMKIWSKCKSLEFYEEFQRLLIGK